VDDSYNPTRPATRQLGPCLQAAALDANFPGGSRWSSDRSARNARFEPSPAAVVFATSSAHVLAAVTCAKSAGVAVCGRSLGRHTCEPYCGGGLIVDVSAMRQMSVSPATKTAAIGAGATLGQVYVHLDGYELALPGGTCGTVGIAGLVLGGGKGRMTRLHGLTSDMLLAVELVTPSGERVTANASHHADLFWLARGGQFPGVATAFHFRLVDRPSFVTSFTYRYAVSAAVFAHWQSHLLEHSERRLHVRLQYDQWNGLSFYGTAFEMGRTEVEALMAPTRAALGWGNASYTTRSWLQDLMANTGVNSAAQLTSGSHGWGSEWSVAEKKRSLVFTPLDAFGLAKLTSEVSGAPSTGFYLQLDPTSGAVCDLQPGATAYAWREKSADGRCEHITMGITNRWSGRGGNTRMEAHSRRFHAALAAHAGVRAYANYIDLDHATNAGASGPLGNAYFGAANAQRIADVIARYDDTGTFRAADAIALPPAVLLPAPPASPAPPRPPPPPPLGRARSSTEPRAPSDPGGERSS